MPLDDQDDSGKVIMQAAQRSLSEKELADMVEKRAAALVACKRGSGSSSAPGVKKSGLKERSDGGHRGPGSVARSRSGSTKGRRSAAESGMDTDQDILSDADMR
eukprot:1057978-Karenia_brevis.AAC.1